MEILGYCFYRIVRIKDRTCFLPYNFYRRRLLWIFLFYFYFEVTYCKLLPVLARSLARPELALSIHYHTQRPSQTCNESSQHSPTVWSWDRLSPSSANTNLVVQQPGVMMPSCFAYQHHGGLRYACLTNYMTRPKATADHLIRPNNSKLILVPTLAAEKRKVQALLKRYCHGKAVFP